MYIIVFPHKLRAQGDNRSKSNVLKGLEQLENAHKISATRISLGKRNKRHERTTFSSPKKKCVKRRKSVKNLKLYKDAAPV